MAKGKFIVIDGSDGSGKATQTRLLVNRLRKSGYKVKLEDFPQYGKKSAGPVEDYLNGIYGDSDKLGAYIPSVFFSVDRFAASERIRKNLRRGYTVVSNRYTTGNMAHQGGKIKNPAAREKYFKWLIDLEYNFFKIPKPDKVIILHLPTKVSMSLIKKRKKDIHEKDFNHLAAAEQVYLEIAKKFKYPVIEGFVKGKLLTPNEVSDKIWRTMKLK